MNWNEFMIARAIALQTLDRRCLLLVNNCTWPGNECDLLGVTENLRLIDVEVKISRADLKADRQKDKWWKTYFPYGDHHVRPQPNFWPPRVWKHYYAMPADIWKPELLDSLASPESGVLLLTAYDGHIQVRCERRAKPNKNAYRLKPEQVIDIARLSSLRMWDAYANAEKARIGEDYWRQKVQSFREAGRVDITVDSPA